MNDKNTIYIARPVNTDLLDAQWAWGSIVIDEVHDNTKPPSTVCTIYVTHTGQTVVSSSRPASDEDTHLWMLIEESKEKLIDAQNKRHALTGLFDKGHPSPYTLVVYPYIIFDDDTAVICQSTTEHETPPTPHMIQDICALTADFYRKKGKTPVSFRAVSKAAYEAFCKKYPEGPSVVLTWDEDTIHVEEENGGL